MKALDVLQKTRTQLEYDHKLAEMYDEAISELESINQYIQALQATIEAQEIIIKDMAQPETCEWCIHYDGDFDNHPCNKCAINAFNYYHAKE